MEYASGGELYDYINSDKLTPEEARRFFQQVVSAIHYCHKVRDQSLFKPGWVDGGFSNIFTHKFHVAHPNNLKLLWIKRAKMFKNILEKMGLPNHELIVEVFNLEAIAQKPLTSFCIGCDILCW